MKILWLIGFLVLAVDVVAQEKIEPTEQFAIEGKVKNRLSFLLKNLNVNAQH